jgi:hypothetical protein
MSFKQEGTWTRNLSQKAWKMKWVFGLREKGKGVEGIRKKKRRQAFQDECSTGSLHGTSRLLSKPEIIGILPPCGYDFSV